MDTLSEILEDVRSTGALLDRTLVAPPWSVDVEGTAPLTLLTMVQGNGFIRMDDRDPLPAAEGDRIIVTGSHDVSVSSAPDDVMVPSCVVRAWDGERFSDDRGGDPCGSGDALLVGSFSITKRVAERLLRALPDVLSLPAGDTPPVGLSMLQAEIGRATAGRDVVAHRLLDLLLVGTVRDWFALPGADTPAWYAAASDPVVGPTLRAMQDAPDRAWSVESLAQEAGVSRTTFARHFTTLMGEPPMAYLTGWRLCLASDLLTGTDRTLDAIARDVGYSSGYALSAAFTRAYGERPSLHRTSSRT
jgi:AraC-like DNA-binding protein